MASASTGLELPATSLIAPFLPVIPRSPAPGAALGPRRMILKKAAPKSASKAAPQRRLARGGTDHAQTKAKP
jgi:hypothetical protein